MCYAPVAMYGRIVNNFLHDLATGTWAAALLVLLVLRREASGLPPEAVEALGRAGTELAWLCTAALVVIGATGGIRTRYWRLDTPPDQLEAKRRALVVKHLLLLVLYLPGTWWAWQLRP